MKLNPRVRAWWMLVPGQLLVLACVAAWLLLPNLVTRRDLESILESGPVLSHQVKVRVHNEHDYGWVIEHHASPAEDAEMVRGMSAQIRWVAGHTTLPAEPRVDTYIAWDHFWSPYTDSGHSFYHVISDSSGQVVGYIGPLPYK
ncbi:MAG: hypothetical protein M5U25_14895 [Planctomycetota bacterium]|nr:hypothetical protein [Planctomycetota bacterium]